MVSVLIELINARGSQWSYETKGKAKPNKTTTTTEKQKTKKKKDKKKQTKKSFINF